MSGGKFGLQRRELEEIASAIVAELSGQAPNGGFGLEYTGHAGDETASYDRQDNKFRRSEYLDGSLGFGQGTAAVFRSELGLPRLERRDFLEQRLARHRNVPRLASKSGGAFAKTAFDAEIFDAETFDADGEDLRESAVMWSRRSLSGSTPELLSEAFCRDARRYDGGFERY